MKKIQCDGCGSSDFVKQDGLFVCQYCGLKYSSDEISNMMKVRVDNSQKISNLYELARRAKKDNNWDKCSKYYEMILIEGSLTWEAVFYSDFSELILTSGISSDQMCFKLLSLLDSVLQMIKKDVSDLENQEDALLEMSQKIYDVLSQRFQTCFFERDMTDKISLNENLAPIIDTIYSLGDKIDISFSDNENICVLCASIWELGIKMDRQMLRYSLNSKAARKRMLLYSNKAVSYDEKFKPSKFGLMARIKSIINFR